MILFAQLVFFSSTCIKLNAIHLNKTLIRNERGFKWLDKSKEINPRQRQRLQASNTNYKYYNKSTRSYESKNVIDTNYSNRPFSYPMETGNKQKYQQQQQVNGLRNKISAADPNESKLNSTLNSPGRANTKILTNVKKDESTAESLAQQTGATNLVENRVLRPCISYFKQRIKDYLYPSGSSVQPNKSTKKSK